MVAGPVNMLIYKHTYKIHHSRKKMMVILYFTWNQKLVKNFKTSKILDLGGGLGSDDFGKQRFLVSICSCKVIFFVFFTQKYLASCNRKYTKIKEKICFFTFFFTLCCWFVTDKMINKKNVCHFFVFNEKKCAHVSFVNLKFATRIWLLSLVETLTNFCCHALFNCERERERI